MNDENEAAETVECAYCSADATDCAPPAVSDNAAWAAIAKEHASSCPWVVTRAHRLTVKRYACTVTVVDAGGDLVRFAANFGSEVDSRTVSSGMRVDGGELFVFDVAGDEAAHDHVLVTLEADDRVLSFQARVLS